MNLLYILPAYNCAATLPRILNGLPKDSTIVVDDGSSDGTYNVAAAKDFKFIKHEKNRGVGAALKTAIAYGLDSGFDYGITIDADGQHSVEQVSLFKTALTRDEFVIGNRFHSLEETPDCKLASNLFASLIVGELFSVKLHDVTCGLRGFKLDKDLLNIDDDSYGFLYRHLFEFLAREKPVGSVEIECIYPYDQPLCTRVSELWGLIGAASAVNKGAGQVSDLLSALTQRIRRHEDLYFSISGINFYAYYVDKLEAYVFQVHKRSINQFHVGI